MKQRIPSFDEFINESDNFEIEKDQAIKLYNELKVGDSIIISSAVSNRPLGGRSKVMAKSDGLIKVNNNKWINPIWIKKSE